VQRIKIGTPHEQRPARRPVPSIDDDVRGLAGIAPWFQKNGMPHNAVKLNLQLTKRTVYTKEREGDRRNVRH
jgi:hypothetical protein